jgi:propionyl-CoA carboxylase alpha chain
MHAIAAALWLQARRRAAAAVLRHIPSGWRNNPGEMQEAAFSSRQVRIDVRYRQQRSGTWDVAIDDRTHSVAIEATDVDSISLSIDGVRRTFQLFESGQICGVHSVLGLTDLTLLPRFPTHEAEHVRGGCQAPMPGKVLEVRVAAGDAVHSGDLLVVLEAMKMEHQIVAAADGTIAEVRVAVGQQVDAGEVLIVLESDEAKQDTVA